MLGLNFDQVGINKGMTHVMDFSAKVRRNEQLWQTLDIESMFEPTSGLENS